MTTNQIHITIKYKKYERAVSSEAALLLCKGENNIQELKLTSPIAPSVNHYLGWRAILKNGKPMAVGYKKPEAIKYQKEFAKYVKTEAKKQTGLNRMTNHSTIIWIASSILTE